LVGVFGGGVRAHGVGLLVCAAGTCVAWPALEALVSENGPPLRLQQRIGVYNLVWAGTGAFAYFSGGAMIERFGLKVLFSVPLAVHVVELGLIQWLQATANSRASPVGSSHLAPVALAEIPLTPRPIARVKPFLRMAWLANPFTYL